MNIEKTFKNLIYINLILLAGIIVSAFYPTLPSELYNWDGYTEFQNQAILWLGIPLILIYVVSIILILNFKSYGRSWFLFATVFGAVTLLAMGPFITAPIDEFMSFSSAVIDGVLIGMMYFSPLKDRFSK